MVAKSAEKRTELEKKRKGMRLQKFKVKMLFDEKREKTPYFCFLVDQELQI